MAVRLPLYLLASPRVRPDMYLVTEALLARSARHA